MWRACDAKIAKDGIFLAATSRHQNAKSGLKGLMPEDAKETVGHGVRAKC
jgi:hypothetical protein